MAEQHRLVVTPPGGGRRSGDVEFLATSDHTPRRTVCTILLDPWSTGVPSHRHDGEDDAFYVLEGALTFEGDGESVVATAGTFVLAPPGVLHGFHNHTGNAVRLLNITLRPGSTCASWPSARAAEASRPRRRRVAAAPRDPERRASAAAPSSSPPAARRPRAAAGTRAIRRAVAACE